MRKGFCFFTNESSGPLGPTALRIVTAVLQSPQWQTRPVHHNRCTGLAMYKPASAAFRLDIENLPPDPALGDSQVNSF